MMTAIPVLLALAVTPDGCHLIQNDIIFARDIAAVIPAFAQIPAEFRLGYVSTSGEPRILLSADLQRIARNQRVEVGDIADLCFERETFVPQPEQIRDAMLSELKSADLTAGSVSLDSAKVEILAWSQHPVPVGSIVFPFAGMQPPQGAGAQREVLWNGFVRDGDGRQFPVWAKARITANVTRVVAAASIPSGKPIQRSQVRLETLEDFPFDETLAHSLDEVAGYLAKSSLRAGAPIKKTQVERAPDVARGDLVIVEIIAGGAHLRMEGRAESAGIKGTTILVRNLSSGKDFRAEVTGKNQATVGMAGVDPMEEK